MREGCFQLVIQSLTHNQNTFSCMKKTVNPFALCLTAVAIGVFPQAANASDPAELKEVVIKGEAEDVPVQEFIEPAPVAPVAAITGKQIESINAPNPPDVFKFLPSVTVRKRYIGDHNVPMAIRGSSLDSTAQTVVYADDFLLSNFLGGHSAGARWFMVSPEEIAGADILYGPYSAIYPGNSIGGVATIHTRMPEEFEFHSGGSLYLQKYSDYGTDDHHFGYKFDLGAGDKKGKFGYYLNYRHFENEAPAQSLRAESGLRTPSPSDPVVTGAYAEIDARGTPRFIYGSIGPRDIAEDLVKLKLTYDLNDNWTLTGLFGYLNRRESQVQPETYLRDLAGNPVYFGNFNYMGNQIRASFQGADRSFLEDFNYALTLKGSFGDGWKLTTTASFYDLTGTRQRSGDVNNAGVIPGTGTVLRQDGTGWYTYDIKLAHESDSKPAWLGQKAVFGYHFDNYFRREVTEDASDWRKEILTGVNTITDGQTMTHALFIENTWALGGEWSLTLGGRQEFWEAYDGFLQRGTNARAFEDRDDSYFSPKGSLAWHPNEDWEVRFSVGLAKRFPLVDELFQANFDNSGNFDPNSFDPNLKPEKAFSRNLSVSRLFEKARVTASVFHETIEDSIFRQPNFFSGTTHFQNIDEIRNWGGELAFDSYGLGLEHLSFHANIGYVNARITENSRFPASEGKRVPRVPEWRANAFATYALTPKLDWTVGVRYGSDHFNDLDNSDGARGGAGFTDGYLVFDTKLAWNIGKGFRAAIGVDNIGDERYYVVHPYPGRTYYFDLNWTF